MAFYDDESSNEEDNISHVRENNGSDGYPKPEHSNGRVFSSGDRINRENAGQKFVHGSDDEGSYENINEKDVGYNSNRIARNSSDEHPSFQKTVDDFRDSDSEIERGERNYLPQSKHRNVYKANDNDSISENEAGDDDYKETNRDEDFVVSEGDEEDNVTYSGRSIKSFVSERSAKAKGKQIGAGVRTSLKRE